MADYKELLRRAINALPENNGAARRAVYEKARSALVAQLRAISPPLPPKDITQHRLQLEDCIRQVEQETSEALLTRSAEEAAAPRPASIVQRPAVSVPQPAPAPPSQPAPEPREQAPSHRVESEVPADDTIEAIIAEAQRGSGGQGAAGDGDGLLPSSQPEPAPVPQSIPKPSGRPEARGGPRPIPTVVARAEPAKMVVPVPAKGTEETSRPSGVAIKPVREPVEVDRAGGRASQPAPLSVEELAPVAVSPALSSVREVEVEQPFGEISDAEGAIDRAIAVLDREARGESTAATDEAEGEQPEVESKPILTPAARKDRRREALENAFRPAQAQEDPELVRVADVAERSGSSALTIFLAVFVVLLLGAGGAGYWAWTEGFLNVQALFGSTPQVANAPATGAAQNPVVATAETETQTAVPELEEPEVTSFNTGPTTQNPQPTVALGTGDEQLVPSADPNAAPTAVTVAPTSPVNAVIPDLPAAGPTGGNKTLEQLPASVPAEPGPAVPGAADPLGMAGTQSLLLEASDDGATGAVPFSGTVEWSKGADETGQPTLVGKANIPARNLSVDVLIRRNTDPILPASHLMEVNFNITQGFTGGSIAGLPGVLLKNEELVQGTPLVGASARVTGNSFLFALSASPDDSAANSSLLTSRKWMDLALIYGTGKRAIITMEKDDQAQQMFGEVFAAWAQTATASQQP